MSKIIIVKCDECGAKISRYPSQIKKNNYCSIECSSKHTYIKKNQRLSIKTEFKKKQKPHNYKGKIYTQSRSNSGKYVLLYLPNHHLADKKGYVREHRLVAETKIGRFLLKDEIVHHIDGNTLNNNPDNLQVMKKKDHDRNNTPLNIHKRWH